MLSPCSRACPHVSKSAQSVLRLAMTQRWEPQGQPNTESNLHETRAARFSRPGLLPKDGRARAAVWIRGSTGGAILRVAATELSVLALKRPPIPAVLSCCDNCPNWKKPATSPETAGATRRCSQLRSICAPPQRKCWSPPRDQH